MTIIYILELEREKYYVGRTENLDVRIQQHKENKENKGSEWTRIYPYKSTVESFSGDNFDEDGAVIRYMTKYGIENVRGGSFSNPELSLEQMLAIRRAIYNATDRCLACGLANHKISSCYAKICMRCHRTGHKCDTCEETTHFNNGILYGCNYCGRADHWPIFCNRKEDIFGRKLY